MIIRLLVLSLCFVAFISNAFSKTYVRNYTTSEVVFPKECTKKENKKACNHIASQFVQEFERARVLEINSGIDFVKYEDIDFSRATQKVSMHIVKNAVKDIITLYVLSNRSVRGKETRGIDVFNVLPKDDMRSITFDELFAKPERARMIIASKAQSAFEKYRTTLLPVEISLLQVAPANFAVTKNGLDFYFAPGQVSNLEKSFDVLKIDLKSLKKAQPHLSYWNLHDEM